MMIEEGFHVMERVPRGVPGRHEHVAEPGPRAPARQSTLQC